MQFVTNSKSGKGGDAEAQAEQLPDAIKALVQKGRPDFNSLFAELKASPTTSSAVNSAGASTVGIYSCGPKPMMRSVAKSRGKLLGKGNKVYLHEETFEL